MPSVSLPPLSSEVIRPPLGESCCFHRDPSLVKRVRFLGFARNDKGESCCFTEICRMYRKCDSSASLGTTGGRVVAFHGDPLHVQKARFLGFARNDKGESCCFTEICRMYRECDSSASLLMNKPFSGRVITGEETAGPSTSRPMRGRAGRDDKSFGLTAVLMHKQLIAPLYLHQQVECSE